MILWRSVIYNMLWLSIWYVQWDHAGCVLGFIGTGFKVPNNPPEFLRGSHLTVKIYLWSASYYLMGMGNFSLVSSSGGCSLLLFCKYAAVPNNISLCYFSFMSFLIYVVTLFLGAERGTTPMWQVLYVGINPGRNCSFLMAPTSYFF